jgi:hypothetical protein
VFIGTPFFVACFILARAEARPFPTGGESPFQPLPALQTLNTYINNGFYRASPAPITMAFSPDA